jgi:hypothetical protein
VSTWEELSAKHIKASLLDATRPTRFTIESVAREILESPGKGKRPMPVLKLKETDKDLPLNSTNRQCMAAMFGEQAENCINKRVDLFVGRDRSPETGQMEPCVRIWGSPDIAQDIEATVKLPQRKPKTMTMHATGRGAQAGRASPPGAAPAAAPPPADLMPEPEVLALLERINGCSDLDVLTALRDEAGAARPRLTRDAKLAIKAALEGAAERCGGPP